MNFTDSTNNRQSRQWSIKSLLLWTFIIALAIPYLLALVPVNSNPVAVFKLGKDDLLQWLTELDPNVQSIGKGGGGGTDQSTSYHLDYEYAFSSTIASEQKMFNHLKEKLQQKMNNGVWNSRSISASGDYQAMYFSNAFAAYRVYIWKIPTTSKDQDLANNLVGNKAHTLRVKWLTVGYSSFHGRWPAKVVPAD